MHTSLYHLTDLHGDLTRAEVVVSLAVEGSLIAITGDIIDWNGKNTDEEIQSAEAFLSRLAVSAARKACRIVTCSGNHDVWALQQRAEHPWLATTSELICLPGAQVVVTSLPWRDYEHPGDIQTVHPSEIPRFLRDMRSIKDCEDALADGARMRMETACPWVVLHHNPPTNAGTCRDGQASEKLAEWIIQYAPEIALCGHIHNPTDNFFQIGETTVSNPGSSPAVTRYNRIDLTTPPALHSCVV